MARVAPHPEHGTEQELPPGLSIRGVSNTQLSWFWVLHSAVTPERDPPKTLRQQTLQKPGKRPEEHVSGLSCRASFSGSAFREGSRIWRYIPQSGGGGEEHHCAPTVSCPLRKIHWSKNEDRQDDGCENKIRTLSIISTEGKIKRIWSGTWKNLEMHEKPPVVKMITEKMCRNR